MIWYPSLALKSYIYVWLILSGAAESWIFLHPPGVARELERIRRESASHAYRLQRSSAVLIIRCGRQSRQPRQLTAGSVAVSEAKDDRGVSA